MRTQWHLNLFTSVRIIGILSLSLNVFALTAAAVGWLARNDAGCSETDNAVARLVTKLPADAARDPFDPVQFEKSLSALRQSRLAIIDVRIQLYTQVVPQLSAQGHQELTRTE